MCVGDWMWGHGVIKIGHDDLLVLGTKTAVVAFDAALSTGVTVVTGHREMEREKKDEGMVARRSTKPSVTALCNKKGGEQSGV